MSGLCVQRRTCGCAIRSDTLSVAGSGSGADPYVIDVALAGTELKYYTFLNAAARDLALPSPAEGQMCWLQTENQETRYFPALGGWRVAYQSHTSFTPTPSQFVVGNGSISGSFWREGDTVHYRGRFVYGTTSSWGALPGVNLPVPAQPGFIRMTGQASIVHNTGVLYAGEVDIASSGTVMTFYCTNATNYPPSASNPMVWAANSEFEWSIAYVAA